MVSMLELLSYEWSFDGKAVATKSRSLSELSGGSQLSETPVLRDSMSSSDLCPHCTHVMHIHAGKILMDVR